MAAFPNTLLTITLASNFGTFLLYMLSCITCMVAYHNHPQLQLREAPGHSSLRSAGEPGLHGVLSDRAVHGIRHQNGAAAALWGSRRCGRIYGGIYFIRSSKSKGRTTLVNKRFMAAQ